MSDEKGKEAAKPRTIPKYMNFIIGGTAGYVLGIATTCKLLHPVPKPAYLVVVVPTI